MQNVNRTNKQKLLSKNFFMNQNLIKLKQDDIFNEKKNYW